MQNIVRAEAYYEVFEQIVAVVHSSTNVREVLDIIVWKVSEILQAKGTVLRILNLEKNELELGAAYGLSEQYLIKGPVSSSKTIMELYEKNRVSIVHDIWNDPRVQYPQEAWDEGITTILDLPITLQKHLIGIIRVFFSDERKFSPADLDFLNAIARQCACALERARLFEEQQIRYEQLIVQTERLSALGRMAAGIAHEINNPLGGILLFTTSVRKEIKEDGPVKQCLDIVIRETIRCREIIQNLLEFAREKQPQRAPTNINSVLEKTLGLLENVFLVNGIKLRRNLQPELPDCYVDGNQIQQIFLNLLLNAVEAIGQSGVITVRTRFNPDFNCIVAEVEDTGCGIPREILPRIFDPFFSTKPMGNGLGLAMTYGIIKSHGGELKAFSSHGEGTRFIVELPIYHTNGL
ncbi:MAG: ATP-binding protein [Syntrophobacteraceae bacterium]|jgi:signal transduction histidine kinase